MVLLTTTPAAKVALVEYCRRQKDIDGGCSDEAKERREKLSTTEIGSPLEHHELVEISRFLVHDAASDIAKAWRLDSLLKGAHVYQPPPPSKPEPVRAYAPTASLPQYANHYAEQRVQTLDAAPTCRRRTTTVRTNDQPSSSTRNIRPTLPHGDFIIRSHWILNRR